MLFDLLLGVWAGYVFILLYRFNHARWPTKKNTTVAKTKEPACKHAEVEQVEVGDGILAPREVVAQVCTSCFVQLPADYSGNYHRNTPFGSCACYWTEEQERLATRKDKQCQE